MSSSDLKGDNLFVTTYEFKSNIAHYMKRLRHDPAVRSIILKRYEKQVALIVPIPDD